jgi:hypothetical protein
VRPHQGARHEREKKDEKQISMGKKSPVGIIGCIPKTEKRRQKWQQGYRVLRVGPQLHFSIMHIYKMESTTSVLPK